LLLMRAGIGWRLGVKGYAGGHSGAQQCVPFDGSAHVGRFALRFAELLGAETLPAPRPQIFLSAAEVDDAERAWQRHARTGQYRIVVAPGGNHAGRAWGVERFVELGRRLINERTALAAVGAPPDKPAGAALAAHGALDVTGTCSLRQTAALISRADLVVSNSSFAMHAAAAASVPAIVVLGEGYQSASAHAAQWGHGGLTTVLGLDVGRARIFEPAEVVGVIARQNDFVRTPA
jgi:ADP-heptose:LPS heptosyltransferase